MSNFEFKQFHVNEAWIVFRINEHLIRTECDGDFHVYGLMDAASGYMLGTEFISSTASELSAFQAKHILKSGYDRSTVFPAKLVIQKELQVKSLVQEADALGIEVSRATKRQLWSIIGEAVEGFNQHIGGTTQ